MPRRERNFSKITSQNYGNFRIYRRERIVLKVLIGSAAIMPRTNTSNLDYTGKFISISRPAEFLQIKKKVEIKKKQVQTAKQAALTD